VAYAGRLYIIVATALVCAGCTVTPASRSGARSHHELEQYRIRRGELVSAETTFTGMRGRYATYRVRLTSDAGLVATGQLLRPGRELDTSATHLVHPAVLLNDGRELDSRAVDYLPREFGDVVVLSLDYPSALPLEIRLGDALFRGRQLREAAEQVPSLFSLGASYLAGRADVDSTRVAIAATSFAVPFAVIAAAFDTRFRNVVLVYGAGDLDRVLAANLTLRPRALRDAAAWLALRPFRELEPERYAALIAPRPLVMVNGIDDPQMPRSAVEALYAAAREPKSLVWLRTGHLMPTDSTLIRALVDTALARLPVLRGVRRRGETASGDRAARKAARPPSASMATRHIPRGRRLHDYCAVHERVDVAFIHARTGTVFPRYSRPAARSRTHRAVDASPCCRGRATRLRGPEYGLPLAPRGDIGARRAGGARDHRTGRRRAVVRDHALHGWDRSARGAGRRMGGAGTNRAGGDARAAQRWERASRPAMSHTSLPTRPGSGGTGATNDP
jgi:fermentation-respiration switch protein FrsA (DUF1100 family)